MIPEVNPYNNYRGDGVATLFDYDFFIQNGSQLIVEHIDENDVVTRLEENIDYEIVVIEEEFAGYIKFPIEDSKFGILQENETLSLQLTLPFEQISEYGQSSLLDLNSIEFSLDYLTRLCQILKRQMERSVRVNEGSEATPEQLLETINNNAIVSTNAANIASKSANEANKALENLTTQGEQLIENVSREVERVTKTVEGIDKNIDKIVNHVAFNLFDTKISDHILKGNESKGWAMQGTYVSGALYSDFYNRCVEEKNSGTATETTLADTALTMFVNDNGHQFYNISDKSIVDAFYEIYGIADYYGIDEENERIFLPRNKYFALTGGVMGNGMALGLTDGTNNFSLGESQTTIKQRANYGGEVGTVTSAEATVIDNASIGLATDSTKSGIALKANESKYLYYCVGNTVVNNAKIDAGGLVSQMELKANTSLDNLNDSAKTYFDGQWTPKGIELFSTTKDQTVEVSLADYLPVDNFAYEVMVTGLAYTSSTSGSGVVIDVGTSLVEQFVITYARTRASAQVQSGATTVTPIGVDRKMTIDVAITSGGTGKIQLTGYRRLGTSF